MERLPQEICDEIAALSSDGTGRRDLAFNRPALATISRKWQMAFEKQTFQSIILMSTELESFQVIVRDHRRCFLKNIYYSIVLPPYSEEESDRFEREPDRRANDDAFTAAMYGMFQILHTWDENESGFISFSILQVFSPTDKGAFPRVIPPRRCKYTLVSLLQPEDLPVVRIINHFVTRQTSRLLCSRVTIDIAAKLPNLSNAYCYVRDTERRYPAMRRRQRHALAQRIGEVVPKLSRIQTLRMMILHNFIGDHSWQPADLRDAKSAVDPLSNAIREATACSENLEHLVVYGVIDESLFWPCPAPVIVEPFWQSLRILDIRFDTTTPTGGWYFQAPTGVDTPPPATAPSDSKFPPGYSDSEEEDVAATLQYNDAEDARLSGSLPRAFRSVPDEPRLLPLMVAFGKACSQMAGLKEAALITKIPVHTQAANQLAVFGLATWGVWIMLPGASSHKPLFVLNPAISRDLSQRKLIWDVQDWRPEEDLRTLFRSIGRERYGNELVEMHVDTWATVEKPRLERWVRQRLGPPDATQGAET